MSADIKYNGGRRELTSEEKKEHLIQLKRRALESMEQLPDVQFVSNMFKLIQKLITDDTTDEDVEKHKGQIMDTWERYFPTHKKKKKKTLKNLTSMSDPESDIM